jgi:hypothetical protein
MKSGNTEIYRQVWENSGKYRHIYILKMWRQRFIELRLRNTDTQIEDWAIHA